MSSVASRRASLKLAAANGAPAPSRAPAPRRPAADRARSRAFVKAQRLQSVSGALVLGVAGALVALSLSHLAHGIATATGSGAVDSWLMAVGIDAGFVATEAAMLTASTDTIRRKVELWGRPTVYGLVALSMLVNAFAFASAAPGWAYGVAATILGATIPALVFVLSRIAFAMLTTLKR